MVTVQPSKRRRRRDPARAGMEETTMTGTQDQTTVTATKQDDQNTTKNTEQTAEWQDFDPAYAGMEETTMTGTQTKTMEDPG